MEFKGVQNTILNCFRLSFIAVAVEFLILPFQRFLPCLTDIQRQVGEMGGNNKRDERQHCVYA